MQLSPSFLFVVSIFASAKRGKHETNRAVRTQDENDYCRGGKGTYGVPS